MIPSVLCYQLNMALMDFIKTTFPVSNPYFENLITGFLEKPNKVFREPYLSVQLPFRVSPERSKWFESFDVDFLPFVHQVIAFERLTGSKPLNTLIATGTGSGKTECFLYPILDYCWLHRGETGIKAIIIYPMNALATDQAIRLAEFINNNSALRGNIRAGMYVGEKDEIPSNVMQNSKIITDREAIRNNPPDILLTNYKMLDYLLVRPQDARLWRENKEETLKFLVVDELHTFDGAQGTDLACLLRRLKKRLFTPNDYLTCIGTSATMGSGNNKAELINFAENIFAEPLEDAGVITEDRLSAREFNAVSEKKVFKIPDEEQCAELMKIAMGASDKKEYVSKAFEAWFQEKASVSEVGNLDWRIGLSEKLRGHAFFRDLISALDGKKLPYDVIAADMQNIYPVLKGKDANYNRALYDSIIALIAYSRENAPGDKPKNRPFLHVHLHFWFRELRRMMAGLKEPVLEFSDDINDQQKAKYLPVVNCRDCGATGWASVMDDNSSLIISDLGLFYNLFFKYTGKISMLFPSSESNVSGHAAKLCLTCATVNAGLDKEKCFKCGKTEFCIVEIPELKLAYDNRRKPRSYICPYCGSGGGVTLVGAQAATLISAGVSQLFASRFNDDKKMLAFSDSVQDASHRAGFFNARTWRFNLRTAIQHFINDKGDGLLLSEFSSAFVEYWRKQMNEKEYLATFVAPNQTWRRVFEEMIKSGELKGDKKDIDDLFNIVKKRLDLEIIYEYGYNARIGRTLEKSGASTVNIDKTRLEKAVDDIYLKATNEIGELRKTDKKCLEQMVAGLIIRLKNNGAIYRDFLGQYLLRNGDSYCLTNDWKKWLPSQARGRELPRFLTYPNQYLKPGSFDVVSKRSWFYKWITKFFHEVLIREDLPLELMDLIVKELLNAGILTECFTNKGHRVWGINPEAVRVSNAVLQVKCQRCGHSLSVAVDEEWIWADMPCHQDVCNGVYASASRGLDFYGNLFSTGELCRVFSREHTGLLSREEREDLENEFKKSRDEQNPWDTNILSCTPTLEMGISIGDLSTITLCSVPPSQTQYLQRVGRAGRRDGNALSTVVVNAQQHDLYFYGEPSEMISAEITPPSIFLDASAVLERQFVAFCFDCWVKSGIKTKDVPVKLGSVLVNLKNKDRAFFPFNYLNFVETNLTDLLEAFLSCFHGIISDNTKQRLESFAMGNDRDENSLAFKIINALTTVYQERESIRKEIKKISDKIGNINQKVPDSSFNEDLNELQKEKGALSKVVRSISDKNTYNFFTDEGLLPNYAFPEAGIILKSVIFRKTKDEDDSVVGTKESGVLKPKKNYNHYVYEYSRPAVSAIHELAPANSFYAGGRKNRIDRIDMNTSEPELWRLCPNCSHSSNVSIGEETVLCPKCGDQGWADQGQCRQMLRLKMVYSNEDYVKSRSGDESDQREEIYYCKQMLVDVDADKDVKKAFRVDDENSPFGFEYADKAVLKEINFGEIDDMGDKLSVAGILENRKGFKICRVCGKIQTGNPKRDHVRTCRNYGKTKSPLNNNSVEECFYLYREFSTEILRLLIPVAGFEDSNIREQSFTAAVLLGLKLFFGGVDHLRICASEEPVPDSLYRKNYLTIYDSVPGGTGYLKELVSSDDTMMSLLEKALNYIQTCSCATDPDKDGCYSCLYAYKQSRHIGNISRKVAIDLLAGILKHRGNIQQIKSINDIPVNSLFDSELERRFLEALKRSSNEDTIIELKHQVVNGKPGYFLKIGERIWEVEPQVDFGPDEGIAVNSRADFVLWPARDKNNIKPVVIFTDGYVYHRDQVDYDTAKRMALIKSGAFIVWSLSWKDVENVFASQGDYYRNYSENMSSAEFPLYNKIIGSLGISEYGKLYEKNSFSLLINHLAFPERAEIFQKVAFALGLCITDASKHNSEEDFYAWEEVTRNILPDGMFLPDFLLPGRCVFGKKDIPEDDLTEVEIISAVKNENINSSIAEKMFIAFVFEDRENYRSQNYEASWNGLLKLLNIFQFIPNSLVFTKKGIEEHAYTSLVGARRLKPGMLTAQYEIQPEKENDEWTEIFNNLYEEECLKVAEKLLESGLTVPDSVGYELANNYGEVIAMAEMAWENKKIAILSAEQSDFDAIFKQNGWSVCLLKDKSVDSVVEEMLVLFYQ